MSEPLNLREIERQAQAEAQGRYRLGRESTGAEICLVPNPLAADVLTLVALCEQQAQENARLREADADAERWEALARERGHKLDVAEAFVARFSGLVWQDVIAERLRQDAKWGEQNHDPLIWVPILIEEIGEFSEVSLEARFANGGGKFGLLTPEKRAQKMRTEALHVAAVALAIVECLDRGEWRWPSAAALAKD